MRGICEELGYDCSEPTLIYEDNQACISISEGETDKKRTKHIAKHYHFVREAMKKGLILLIFCKTALQVADIFTKQLFPKHFERLRMVLLGHENWDDMAQRVESVTTAGDDIDDPALIQNSTPPEIQHREAKGVIPNDTECVCRTNLFPTQVVLRVLLR